MLPSIMTTWAYDGSLRKMVGTIEIELFISLQVILVTLQIMDIHPLYNMLLESLWIHTADVMVSFLHQCLNYIKNGTLVTVKAEETLAVVQNVIIPYIEAKRNKNGNLHAFKIVNAEWV
jgi:hypothetical protein